MSELQQYDEGDLVAIPLRDGTWGCGLVARKQRRPEYGVRMAIVYGLRWQSPNVPTLQQCQELGTDDVVTFFLCEDSCLTGGRWPVLGQMPGFSHASWPVLPFLDGSKWFAWIDNEQFDIWDLDRSLIAKDDEPYFRLPYSQCGGGAVEVALTRVLKGEKELGGSSAYTLDAARLETWRRYAPTILAAVERIRARKERSKGKKKTKKRASKTAAARAPKRGGSDVDFWRVIESARRATGAEADGEEFAETLAERLGSLAPEQIESFARDLSKRLDEANTWDLWAAAYVMNGGCSDDGFLYFRAWLIAQGRKVFERAVADPDSLAGARLRYCEEGEYELEDLLEVPARAYEHATGTAMPQSPQPTGAPRGRRFREGDEAELKRRLPKLRRKYSDE